MGSEEKRENKENVERNKYNWSENGESLDPWRWNLMIHHYDVVISNNTCLNQHNFSILLHISSNFIVNPLLNPQSFATCSPLASSLTRPPSPLSCALVWRKTILDYTFELVKGIGKCNNASLKLRTYNLVLFCLCEMFGIDKAYQVDEHMSEVGLSLEEWGMVAWSRMGWGEGLSYK